MEKLFLLLAGHGLADYALQNDFIAKYKSHKSNSEMWPYVLACHALMHGAIVYIITGNLLFGFCETLCHWGIDYLKCDGRINFHTDQWLHIICKILWSAT